MGAPDGWRIGDLEFGSRLILGTGKYPSNELMRKAHEAAGTEMVTVAIRRVNLTDKSQPSLLDFIDRKKVRLLPNTAGCYNAKDAVLTARLAREALGTSLIKLEVIGDEKTLMPDNVGTLEAAKELVADGFTVLPYTSDDPVVCRKLEDLGCPAVMPLAAPIGSGMGIRNPANLRLILEAVKVPAAEWALSISRSFPVMPIVPVVAVRVMLFAITSAAASLLESRIADCAVRPTSPADDWMRFTFMLPTTSSR